MTRDHRELGALAVEVKHGQEVTDIGLTGNWGAISDAIRASEIIPADMDVDAAADEYCTFKLGNQRRTAAAELGHPLECPAWFARP